jgi:hypothetical protein
MTVQVPGGTVTSDGFVPTGWTPPLGDPNSFINGGKNGTGTGSTPAGTPAPKTTPKTTPSGNNAGIPRETWGVYKGEAYDPQAYLKSLIAQANSAVSPVAEDTASTEEDDPLKSLYGYAQGGSIDDLLAYLRK